MVCGLGCDPTCELYGLCIPGGNGGENGGGALEGTAYNGVAIIVNKKITALL